MTVDIGDTIAPNSDQLDAVDLLAGPRVFTIERITKNDAEQPVNIYLKGFPRPYRPGKSMRRVLVSCWGADGATYVGRRLMLWCDPFVQFGGEQVGGVRILKLSHIDQARTVPLLVTRGRSKPYRVEPLPDDIPVSVSQPTLDEMLSLFARNGIAEDQRLAGVNRITGAGATALELITEEQARQVIDLLRQRAELNGPDPDDIARDNVADVTP